MPMLSLSLPLSLSLSLSLSLDLGFGYIKQNYLSHVFSPPPPPGLGPPIILALDALSSTSLRFTWDVSSYKCV